MEGTEQSENIGSSTPSQDVPIVKDPATIDFGTETQPYNSIEDNPFFVSERVTDRDILTLAKNILLGCVVLFGIIMISRISNPDNKGAQDVWDFSKVAINSIVSLVLGLYFGGSKKDKQA